MVDITELKGSLYRVNNKENENVEIINMDGNVQTISDNDNLLDIDDIFYPRDGEIRIIHKGDNTHMTLFVTNQCNSNCIMCPDSENVRRIHNTITYQGLVERIKLFPQNIYSVDVTGGEPTLLKEMFPELLAQIFEKYPDVELLALSNGRSFADKTYTEHFSQFNNKSMRIEIPMHSHWEARHDLISGDIGSFKQTIKGIKNLHNVGIEVGIRIVVSKLNAYQLSELIDFISLEFPFVHYVNIMGMEVMGNAFKNKDKVWIEYEELKPVLEQTIEKAIRNGIETRLYNFPLCAIGKKYWACYRKSITPSKIRYQEACDACELKSYCGGFFASTIANTEFKVKPFRRNE
ncbi:MAG: His-Xaa-Ser system radical SAM maturase HxsC [bacterium]|nr:His-Xaa-Ser system radical SAM maturase HxsC [bacterium]